MPLAGIRLIVDTNTLLRGLAKRASTSGRIVDAIEARRVLLLTSRQVIDEYRVILLDPLILDRFPPLSPRFVEATIRSLVYLSDYFGKVPTRFELPRDRRDEKFLSLAIAGKATHLITFDKDLLSLTTSHGEAAKRLRQRCPGLQIVMPADFMQEHGTALIEGNR